MGDVTTLQRDYSRGVKRDFPRDQMPAGSLWDCVDFIPALIGAPLRKRGGWSYGSAAFGAGTFAAAVSFADFTTGSRLVGIDDAGSLYSVNIATQAVTAEGSTGAAGVPISPPVLHRDVLVIPSPDGTANVKKYVAAGGSPSDLDSSAPDGMYAAVYKDRTLLGNISGNQQRLFFGPGGTPAATWDATSYIDVSFPITGLAALKNAVLVFGRGATERIRGSIPPPNTDMVREQLFDTGCIDARSIVPQGDNVIFANQEGIWLTDGVALENLAETSGFLTYWLALMKTYASTWTLAAGLHRGMYVLSVMNGSSFIDGIAIDLDRKTMFRLSNLKARMFARAEGVAEELYFALRSAARLGALSSIFDPADANRNDAEGTAVAPVLETPFFKDAPTTKRWHRGYLSYELTAPSTVASLTLSYITAPESTSYTAISSTFGEVAAYTRARVPLRFVARGIGFKVAQTNASADTRIHELEVEAHALESSR